MSAWLEWLTVVVKLTQSFTKVRGVLPVTSSHWARVVPPGQTSLLRVINFGKILEDMSVPEQDSRELFTSLTKCRPKSFRHKYSSSRGFSETASENIGIRNGAASGVVKLLW